MRSVTASRNTTQIVIKRSLSLERVSNGVFRVALRIKNTVLKALRYFLLSAGENHSKVVILQLNDVPQTPLQRVVGYKNYPVCRATLNIHPYEGLRSLHKCNR